MSEQQEAPLRLVVDLVTVKSIACWSCGGSILGDSVVLDGVANREFLHIDCALNTMRGMMSAVERSMDGCGRPTQRLRRNQPMKARAC